ncbi:MAG: hypothetical protein WAZ27_00545 [Minisyncoccia bacterium]
MYQKYSELFKKLRPIGAPQDLKRVILERIRMEEKRAAQRVVAVSAPFILASIAGVVWAVESAITSLAQTGFAEYVSLMFSDTSIIVTVWQPLMLSIIESLPFFALTVLVGAGLVFFASTVVAAQNARRAFSLA